MQKKLSYPKNKIKVLLLENIHENAVKIFAEEGYSVELLKTALNEEELIERIKDVSIIGIRSKTKITKKVLDNAPRLKVVGAFCIGTNQIDLDYACKKGVAVFNAPYSNTRSVVEMVIGEIIMLKRRIFDKSSNMHNGRWCKSAEGSFEVRGKALGIIGYGNIGSQLSILAESMGMKVYYYDLVEKLALGNARKCCKLEELLKRSDIVTLHIDGRQENINIFGEKQFNKMKQGSIFLNLSRGFVVDIRALVKYLKNGKLAGAAIDVFPKEPKNNQEEFVSELRGLPNVILTPHIGGSTQEAQFNISGFVPLNIIDFINNGNTCLSVNFPNLQLPEQKQVHRLIHIHENVPGILAEMNNIFAKHKINIEGQYLKTNELIGYVITDLKTKYSKEVIKELREIPNTISLRLLY